MSQDDTPDLATPQTGKVAPEAVALRAHRRFAAAGDAGLFAARP